MHFSWVETDSGQWRHSERTHDEMRPHLPRQQESQRLKWQRWDNRPPNGIVWGCGACCEVYLDSLGRSGQVCHQGEAVLRSRKCSFFVVTAPLVHWYPAEYSILKDHWQPHAELASPGYLHLKHMTHCSKKSPHFYPMLTFKTFCNRARMSWNLVRFSKVFQKINSSSQMPCPLPPKVYLGWMMTIHS